MVDLSEMVQNNLPPLPKVIFNILMEVPSVILNYFFDTVITTFTVSFTKCDIKKQYAWERG